MLKVYFDTNIYSDLTNGIEEDFVIRVKNLAEKEILFLYSQAHLNDLSQDQTDYKLNELNVIEEIADTNFLQQDFQNNRITNSIIKANEAFKLYGENANDLSIAFSNPFAETGIEEIDALLTPLKFTPIDLGEHIQNILARQDNDLEKSIYLNIGITKRHYFLEEFVLVFEKMMYNFQNDKSLLKTIRNKSKEYLNVDKLNLNIDDINFNEKLIKSKIGKSLRDILNQQLSHFTKEQKQLYQEFVTCYNTISFMGFDSEINRNVRFINTLNDAQHSYYGGTADILVSQDKGLINKTKFLYNFYGIETKVMTLHEFKRFLNTYRPIKHTNEMLFITDLTVKMKQSIIVAEKRPIFKYNQIQEVRKLAQIYFGLFNYMAEVHSHENDDVYVILYGSNARISNMTYYKEVNHIINYINTMLKTNYQNLSEDDIKQITDGSWNGLLWETEITSYYLRFNFETYRLGLQIGPLNINFKLA